MISQPRNPSAHINIQLYYIDGAHAFTTFSGQSPLSLDQRHDKIVATLKSIPDSTSENFILPLEKIQEVENIYYIHSITKDDVAIRILASSLKRKALQWYRVLSHDSIMDWDGLGVGLC